MKKTMEWVPQDLVVRVVKMVREGGGVKVLERLELTADLPGREGLKTELVRRMIVVCSISDEQLSERDRVWKAELARAEKALLGVWSGRVVEEAVVAVAVLRAHENRRVMKLDLTRLFMSNVERWVEKVEVGGWCEQLLARSTAVSEEPEES